IPFVQYMKLVRIVKAVEQLSIPGKNVTEVAYEVGYESMPSFSNNFLEIMGRRPNTFLEK
ncbi:MAG: helix-turn-helix domain-containing protein, partial [Flavipsychrobacter sp.]